MGQMEAEEASSFYWGKVLTTRAISLAAYDYSSHLLILEGAFIVCVFQETSTFHLSKLSKFMAHDLSYFLLSF